MRLLLGIAVLWMVMTTAGAAQSPPEREEAYLRVRVENIREAGGRLWVGIYTSEADFLNRYESRLAYFDVTRPGDTTVVLNGLREGQDYALAVYHDLDGDDDLSTNWLGLPAEPWAVSRPLRSYLRKPRFGEMSFPLRSGMTWVLRLR